MKKVTAQKDKNSSKIILIFGVFVFIFILISLIVKVVSMVRVSKFDGVNRFTVAVEKRGSVFGIISFDPAGDTISVLQVRNPVRLSYFDIGKTLGVLPDGVIDMQSDKVFDLGSNNSSLGYIVWHFNEAKTELTFYDVVRLFLGAKSVSMENRRLGSITLPMDDSAVDRTVSRLFSDSLISSENMSIQVVNASGTPGVANSLARVITNMGGNVVSVLSSQAIDKHSHISYFGKKSYSVKKIGGLLWYPVSESRSEGIADIVVTVGKDRQF